MTDGLSPKAPGQVRGRPFEKGRSGNPLGRRVGGRNKTTIAGAMKAVTSALADQCNQPGEAAGMPAWKRIITTHRRDSAADLLQMAG